MMQSPRLLMTHRNTALLLERARVRVEGGRVVYDKTEERREKTFNIPFANLAVLYLGQGTSLTQDAARLKATRPLIKSRSSRLGPDPCSMRMANARLRTGP